MCNERAGDGDGERWSVYIQRVSRGGEGIVKGVRYLMSMLAELRRYGRSRVGRDSRPIDAEIPEVWR